MPESIGQLKKMEMITIMNNPLLRGPIPSGVWNMLGLTLLDLSQVELVGSLPEEIGNLKSLMHLSLSNTRLTGTLPRALGELVSLESLTLMDTAFDQCDFPAGMASLRKLRMVSGTSLRLGSRTLDVLANISSLESIRLDRSELSGTIPEAMATNLRKLMMLSLSGNLLEGPIPALHVTQRLSLDSNLLSGSLDALGTMIAPKDIIDCRHNRISGSIPASLFVTQSLNMAYNRLNGSLPASAFSSRGLQILDLSNNALEGPLPNGTLAPHLDLIDLSQNALTGSIPDHIHQSSALTTLRLGHNNLSGNLPQFNTFELATLELQNNHFSGSMPDLSSLQFLTTLLIAENEFEGSIPGVPTSLIRLDMSHNRFTEGLSNLFALPHLVILDLSYNQLIGTVPSELLGYASRVNMAHNKFNGTIPKGSYDQLSSLDLSFNSLTGELPKMSFPRMIFFQVSHNQLTGAISRASMPYLSYLDISYNSFNFPIHLMSEKALLVTLLAQHNHIYGEVTQKLGSMPALATLDLSSNWLDSTLDLRTLAVSFNHGLQELNILDNDRLPIVTDARDSPYLFRTLQRQPSPDVPNLMCYTLSFTNRSGTYFRFAESLFDWVQCDCQDGFFGLPPHSCFSCPSPLGCSNGELRLPQNNYINGLPSTVETAPTTSVVPPPNNEALPIFVESCLWIIDAEYSNCEGFTLNATIFFTREAQDPDWNAQCRPGSRGRLCSECICDSNQLNRNNPECFFMRGFRCTKCKKVYDPTMTVPLALALVLASVLMMSIPMYLVLHSKRKKKDRRWEELSIFARLFQRFIFALDLGFIPITIIFVQMLVELTNWDAWLINGYSNLINGQVDAIGLSCMFPFMARPLPKLLFRLFLPFVAAFLLSCSIGIAELVSRIWQRMNGVKAEHYERIGYESSSDSFSQLDPSASQSMQLLGGGTKAPPKKMYLAYPSSALLSTVMISVFQFFYFGTALAALEYFFFSIQPNTQEIYVKSQPWMKFADATVLRYVSIPWLIVFVFGLPLAFIVLAILVRDKISAPSISIYFGSIFSRYKRSLFWWEIVNVLKKLIVAILVRAISPSSAMQPASVITILGVAQLFQTTRQPWRMRMENIMDHLGCLLLILSLYASQTVPLSHASASVYTVLAFDGTFVLINLALLIYFAATSKTPYQLQWEAKFKSSDDPILAFTMPLFQNMPHAIAPPSISTIEPQAMEEAHDVSKENSDTEDAEPDTDLLDESFM